MTLPAAFLIAQAGIGYLALQVVGLTITAASNASPSVLTTQYPHGLDRTPYAITVSGCTGNTAPNGSWAPGPPSVSAGVFTAPSSTTIQLPANGNGAYTANSGTVTLQGGLLTGAAAAAMCTQAAYATMGLMGGPASNNGAPWTGLLLQAAASFTAGQTAAAQALVNQALAAINNP